MRATPVGSLTDDFFVQTWRDEGVVVVFLVGDIDLETERHLTAGLRSAVAITDDGLVLDVTRLGYCGPGGATWVRGGTLTCNYRKWKHPHRVQAICQAQKPM
jgi:hypothetical protein